MSLFSVEAEYRYLTNVTKEMIWIQILLLKVHLLNNKPMNTTCDNQSVIKLVSNPMFHVRKNTLKSITITSPEHVHAGDMEVMYMPTTIQQAIRHHPVEKIEETCYSNFNTFTLFSLTMTNRRYRKYAHLSLK